MLMSFIWTAVAAASLLYGAAAGNAAAVGSAAMDGASAAISFILDIGGPICLWCGVMEVMERSGVSGALSRVLRPVLRFLFPVSSRSRETADALTANFSANLLGLGNAATPMGIRAAKGMAALGSRASDELCLLVVINTASIQLLPTTSAALRSAAGASAPFDIIPAVWLSSAISVLSGLAAAAICRRIWK